MSQLRIVAVGRSRSPMSERCGVVSRLACAQLRYLHGVNVTDRISDCGASCRDRSMLPRRMGGQRRMTSMQHFSIYS